MFSSPSRRAVARHALLLRWSQQQQRHVRCLSSSAAAASPNNNNKKPSSTTMELLKDLRARTGAPIVDCRRALAETGDGDASAAADWLREHGAAAAGRRVAGRATAEGLVGLAVADDGRRAALVRVAAETDFAGRTPRFAGLVQGVARAALEEGGGDDPGADVSESERVKGMLADAIVAIRENLSVAKAVQFRSDDDDGILVGYVHNKVESTGPAAVGMSAALVQIRGDVERPILQLLGKRLAMHVVAARPSYLTPGHVPAEEMAKERDILTKQMADSGRPDHIVQKIVEGRLRKFCEDVCLSEQKHMIEDGNPKIGKYLREHGIEVKRFELLSIR